MEHWLAIILSFLSAAIASAVTYLLKKKPIENKFTLEQNQQVINAYRDIVNSHQRQIDILNEKMISVEEKYQKQQSDHAQCRAENEVLQREIAHLKTQIEYLQVMRTNDLNDFSISADIVCDIQSNITEWDPAATLMFGWERAEILGKPIIILLEESYVGRHQAAFAKLMETKEKRPRHGVLHGKARNKLGDVFPVWVVLSTWTEKGEKRFGATIRKDTTVLKT